ncbi:phage tail fiber protein, partial [Providencia sp. PROV138]
VVKLFADDIELNDESEGVEMEHLGVGHYLIKGVVGFNADGAWGINNGFVIPQDHNGKNMVLIDYEVRPDGDIEVFVFHQQNADMPERFQNKRIKHFDEEGVPVYFENYEPCDVPESRWIDMRVEMPPNSLYNQKQAEAERLAKLEAERLAQEEAKRAVEEVERVEQEAVERKQYGLDDNSVLL